MQVEMAAERILPYSHNPRNGWRDNMYVPIQHTTHTHTHTHRK